ncbi:MAG: 30S ribosomal protein S6 [Candidatus Paceibacterota bacterium]|jgi:ribosomal protein S6
MTDDKNTRIDAEQTRIHAEKNEEMADDVVDNEAKIYEVGFHILPSIAPEKVVAEVSAIKEVMEKRKSVFLSEDFPKLKQLSYSIRKQVQGKYQKFNSAYFGWVKFETEPEMLLEIKKELDKNTNILRYLIIKTVKENTLASATQKALLIKGEGVRPPAKEAKKEAEVKTPVSEAELDKTIEELIVE